jgi:hypothetical protein
MCPGDGVVVIMLSSMGNDFDPLDAFVPEEF